MGLQNDSDRNSWVAIVPVVPRFHKWLLILDYHGVYLHEARITCIIYAPNVVCYLEEITRISIIGWRGLSNKWKSTTMEAYSLMDRITSKRDLQFCILHTADGHKYPAAYINGGIITGGLCFAEHQNNKPPHIRWSQRYNTQLPIEAISIGTRHRSVHGYRYFAGF
jgi:hypothetical protein